MLAALTTDTHFGWNGKSSNHHTKRLKALRREMDSRGCKVLLHTGDWAVNRQRQLKRTLQMFRDFLAPETKICACLGNHDFWIDLKEDPFTIAEVLDLHDALFKEFNIHYVEHRGYVVEDVKIIGYDGWYADPAIHKLTNDAKNMASVTTDLDFQAQDAHAYMQRRSYASFCRMLDEDTTGARKVIGLSHFPLFEGSYNGNPKWMAPFAGKCDIICFGHSHQKITGLPVGKALVYNAGSDYSNIQYQFIEV